MALPRRRPRASGARCRQPTHGVLRRIVAARAACVHVVRGPLLRVEERVPAAVAHAPLRATIIVRRQGLVQAAGIVQCCLGGGGGVVIGLDRRLRVGDGYAAGGAAGGRAGAGVAAVVVVAVLLTLGRLARVLGAGELLVLPPLAHWTPADGGSKSATKLWHRKRERR